MMVDGNKAFVDVPAFWRHTVLTIWLGNMEAAFMMGC